MMDRDDSPIGQVSTARVREWLEENLDAYWLEGPKVFVGAVVLADDVLGYLEKDEDWAEAYLLLGNAYERAMPVASALGIDWVDMRTVYRSHARDAYNAATKAFFALGRAERAGECQIAAERV